DIKKRNQCRCVKN
ncbi:UvrABC system protein A, partial [Haemophilus influenzae]